MRAMFSLVALLVGVAILITVFANHAATVSKSGNQAKEQARDLSGHDANGKPAIESITVDAEYVAGQLKGIVIMEIEPGGAMERKFRLMKNDKIRQIGPLVIEGSGSFDTAKAFLQQAFQNAQPLTVIRNNQEITLEATSGLVSP